MNDPEAKREHWDVHRHKDELQVSDFATVYHPERGQLCQCERQWNVVLYHPIRFNDRSAAYKWIQSGTIAELQEGLMNLGVGFSTVAMESNDWDRF